MNKSLKEKFIPAFALLFVFSGIALNAQFSTYTVTEVVESTGAAAIQDSSKIISDLEKKAEEFILKPTEIVYFGYDFFREPIKEDDLNGPVPQNYLLGPGDQVIIDIWGELKYNYLLEVTPEGFIDIPEAGRVYLNGLPFSNLKSRIIGQLSTVYSSYINPRNPSQSRAIVEVTLGKIHGVTVMCMGEVKEPGSHLLKNSRASIFNILRMAGGVKNTGSLRNIKVMKGDGREISFDFYKYFLFGIIDKEINTLQSGDVVFVPMKTMEVTIDGEIKRPAVYELRAEEGLKNLIEISGGYTPKAKTDIVHLIRTEPNKPREYIDIDWGKDGKGKEIVFAPVNGDRYSIPLMPKEKRENFVEISGEGVKGPGIYQYKENMKVLDLVDKALGFTTDAILEKSVFMRTSEDFKMEYSTFSMKDAVEKGGEYNFLLEPMDRVIVYAAFIKQGGKKTVKIGGAVKFPGEYPLADDLKLSNLIYMAGGFDDLDFRRTVYMERADIVRTDLLTQKKKLVSFNLGMLLTGEALEDMYLQSNDEIVVYPFSRFDDRKKVEIKGSVRQPGEYDYFEGMNLKDLIDIAGGLSKEAYGLDAEIASPFKVSKDKVSNFVSSIALDKAVSVGLKGDDIVFIRQRPDVRPVSVVRVEGQVKFPGEYALKSEDERLSSVIQRAGGILSEGFLPGAVFYRTKKDTGRVVVDFEKAIDNNNSRYDPVLFDGDILTIPENDYVIRVEGEVITPGAVQFIPGRDAFFYIEQCGSFTDSARKNRVIFTDAGGRSRSASGFFYNPAIPMGSVIKVPAKPVKKSNELESKKAGNEK